MIKLFIFQPLILPTAADVAIWTYWRRYTSTSTGADTPTAEMRRG